MTRWMARAVGMGLAAALTTTAHAAPIRARPRPTAARPAPASTLSPARFPVSRHVLPNGLVVLLHEDHSVPAVTFWQWYRVGSRDERPGITGISHVFEHMMFNGSATVAPKEYDRVIEGNGGLSNAFTDRDMTAYYEDIASDRLEVLFRVDADRMRGLLLDPAALKSEMEVVKEERRLRIDNDIEGLLDESLYATAFQSSPYRWPVLGAMGDLEAMRRADLVDYFRVHYAPNNCVLVLTGDFVSADALALIRKHFGDIPAQPPPPAPVTIEPPQTAERRAEVHHPAENASFVVGYKAPPARSDDAWALDLLDRILGDGESSRLHRALVYESGVALGADSFFRDRLDSTLFELHVEMKPGRTAREGQAVLDQVMERIVRDGPTARELEKAKNLLEASLVQSLKTNNGAGEQLAFFEHVYGDHRVLFQAIERYRRISIEDCRRVAARVFVPERRTIVELVPTASAGSGR